MRVIKTPYGMYLSQTKAMAEIWRLLAEQRNKPASLRNRSDGEWCVEIKRALLNWSDYVMHWGSGFWQSHAKRFACCYHNPYWHSVRHTPWPWWPAILTNDILIFLIILEFTFKHVVICVLHIFGWDDYLCVSSLLTGTFFSPFFSQMD